MKWILLSIIALMALIIAVVVIGLYLPETHVTARSVTYRVAPQDLFAVVTDLEGSSTWRPDLYKVEPLPHSSAQSSAHRRVREIGKGGPMIVEIIEHRPPGRLVTRITADNRPFRGSWTYEIEPTGAGTRLTITERGAFQNPVFRFMARYVIGYNVRLNAYLEALDAKISQDLARE